MIFMGKKCSVKLLLFQFHLKHHQKLFLNITNSLKIILDMAVCMVPWPV